MERSSESAVFLESSALLEDGGAAADAASQSSSSSSTLSKFSRTVGKVTVVGLAVAGVVVLGTFGNSRAGSKRPRASSLITEPSSKGAHGFEMQPFSEQFGYSKMQKTLDAYSDLGISTLVEPMRATTFGVHFRSEKLREKLESDNQMACTYTVQSTLYGSDVSTPWDSAKSAKVSQADYRETGQLGPITPPASDGEPTDMSTVGFVATIPSPGQYGVSLSCSEEGADSFTATSDVTSYYIRRELRELSDRQRDDFLDAFKVLSETPRNEGVLKYGPSYKSLEDFEIMHVKAAGQRNLDHMHDGMGIATQHTAMTSEFEQALQSVDATVAVPFWDYTIDSAVVANNKLFNHGRPESFSDIFRKSELFTATWFGNTDGTEHSIADGRFAKQEVPRDYEFEVRSAYGFLRAPWNLNPSKYVTRFHQFCGADPGAHVTDSNPDEKEEFPWPTCADHFKMTNTDDYASWYDWTFEIGYKPHGPVHSWIGGIGGECETSWNAMHRNGDLTTIQLQRMKHNAFIVLKNLWRDELIETPKYCSEDTPVKMCMWKGVENFVKHPEVLRYMKQLFGIGKDTPNYETVIQKVLLETPFWPGDHLEAGSPAEASFWPIHPTIDRLIQYKLQVRPFTSMEWGSIKSSLTCQYANECKGHNAYDTTFFQSTVWDEDTQTYVKMHLTNVEVRTAISPKAGSYKMSYLYNHFEWNHCEEFGVNFKKVATRSSS